VRFGWPPVHVASPASAALSVIMFHIVENDEHQRSLWPAYREHSLPRGWRTVGFSGSREACLARIATGEPLSTTLPPVPTAKAPPPAPVGGDKSKATSPRSRAVAVPFPKPQAPTRLFVFPHAGSGASSYHFLARACKDDPIEINLVQYPGREMRIREEPCTDMAAMLDALDEDLHELLLERPFAFLGHSMGALVAFELTRRLAQASRPLPQHLFLSGRQAPQRPALNLPVDAMTDAAFLDAVGRRYNALPAELLSNPEILSLLLPSLRADFKLMAAHHYCVSEPLDIGLTLINGMDDPWVDRDSVNAWQAMTRQEIDRHWLPGGHFYLPGATAIVREVVLRALRLQEEVR